MPPKYYPQVSWIATFTERFVLSFLYLAFAWSDYYYAGLSWRYFAVGSHFDLGYFVQHILMVVLNVSIGLTLLFGRRAAVTPQSLLEIIVPLVTTFFYLTYSMVDQYAEQLPDWLVNNFAPESWQTTLALIGLVISLFGRTISAWGAISLGRSFGIFVAVREIVLHGPYRYVRHPIYLGYIFFFCGLAMAFPCVAYFILIPIHFSLFAWRARLEENRLAEASPSYRDYQKRTGFIFPKLLRPSHTSA